MSAATPLLLDGCQLTLDDLESVATQRRSVSLAQPARAAVARARAVVDDAVARPRVVANVRRILAIEALAACQALEFHRPLVASAALEAVHAKVRTKADAYDRDRVLGPEIEAVAGLIQNGGLVTAAQAVCGALE